MSVLIFAEVFATAAVLISSASAWHVYKTRVRFLSPKAPEVEPFVELVRRGRNLGPRIEVEEPQSTFLTIEQRREKIISLATDPEFLERAAMLRKSHRDNSGLIPPDPAAQSDHALWRERQKR